MCKLCCVDMQTLAMALVALLDHSHFPPLTLAESMWWSKLQQVPIFFSSLPIPSQM
jgi:hypothetical protein